MEWKIIRKYSSVVLIDSECGNNSVLIGEEIPDDCSPHDLIFNFVECIDGDGFNYKHDPFQLIEMENKEKEYRIGNSLISPLQIYMSCIKAVLERFDDNTILREQHPIILSVPHHFTTETRLQVEKEIKKWGYELLKLVKEPYLSLVAYGLDRDFKDSNVLVLDIGCSFNSFVYSIEEDLIMLSSSYKNPRLGGEVITQRLMNYCCEVFQKQFNKRLEENPVSMIRLRNECEKCKIELSNQETSHIHIKTLLDLVDLDLELTREEFEQMNIDLFTECIAYTRSILLSDRFDKIILCGSSMNIPKLRKMIKDLVPTTQEENSTIDWYDTIENSSCIGASIYAHNVKVEARYSSCLINDLLCCSLGVDNSKGEMLTIVERNTVIPCKKTRTISRNIQENETIIVLNIYEGERVSVKDNHKIGSLQLEIPPFHSDNSIEIELIFELQLTKVFQAMITAKLVGYDTEDTFLIDHGSSLSEEEIKELLESAIEYNTRDLFVEIRNSLELLVYRILETINQTEIDQSSFAQQETNSIIRKECTETLHWIETNQHAKNLSQFTSKKQEFEQKIAILTPHLLSNILTPLTTELHHTNFDID